MKTLDTILILERLGVKRVDFYFSITMDRVSNLLLICSISIFRVIYKR